MNVVSLFSGVGGLDMGLERAGMTVIAHCEYDRHASGVLARHWPNTPNHGDVTTMKGHEYAGRTNLVCGGSPCQDLSVAGRRAGLDGDRSGLFWEQCRITAETAASWALWENVAGALSSNGGQDFASVLWGFTGTLPEVPEDGWRSTGLCVGPDRTAVWRMLDAQWFGVAQRRRRVFVVAGPRDLCGPEILAFGQSVSGHPRPSRTQGEEVAGTLGGGAGSRGWSPDTDRMTFVPTMAFNWHVGTGSPGYNRELSPTLGSSSTATVPAVMVEPTPLTRRGRTDGAEFELGEPGVYNSLRAGEGGSSLLNAVLTTEPAVRRLTPVECERLMGWPDDHTAGQADSHRYKQCGNGVVSNCTEWIGNNIMKAAA